MIVCLLHHASVSLGGGAAKRPHQVVSLPEVALDTPVVDMRTLGSLVDASALCSTCGIDALLAAQFVSNSALRVAHCD